MITGNITFGGATLAEYWEARAIELADENEKLYELVRRLGATADEHWAKVEELELEIGKYNGVKQ